MPKPNLVFIVPDQLRADFLSCYGAQCVETPHIDSLAERGVRYDRAYSAHPVCVPARVSLMTGMDGIKTGVLQTGQHADGGAAVAGDADRLVTVFNSLPGDIGQVFVDGGHAMLLFAIGQIRFVDYPAGSG